ncbi:uncharacterized protein LOC115211003 [Argonauta hians]
MSEIITYIFLQVLKYQTLLTEQKKILKMTHRISGNKCANDKSNVDSHIPQTSSHDSENEGNSSMENNNIQSVRNMIQQREKLTKSDNSSNSPKLLQSSIESKSLENPIVDVKDKVKSMVQQFESKICKSLTLKPNGMEITGQSYSGADHKLSSCITSPLIQDNEKIMGECNQESMSFKLENECSKSKTNLEICSVNASLAEYGSQFDHKKSIGWEIDNSDAGSYTISKYTNQDHSTNLSLANPHTFNDWISLNNTRKEMTMPAYLSDLFETSSNFSTTIVQFYSEILNTSVSEIKENIHKILKNTGKINNEEPQSVQSCDNDAESEDLSDSFLLYKIDKRFNPTILETSAQNEFFEANYVFPVETENYCYDMNQSDINVIDCQGWNEEIFKRSSVESMFVTSSQGQDADLKILPTIGDYFGPNVSPIGLAKKTSKSIHRDCISSRWILNELNSICPELRINYDSSKKSGAFKLMKTFDDLKNLVSSLKDDGKNTAVLFEENKEEMRCIWKHMKDLQTKYCRLHSQSIKDNLKLAELSKQGAEIEWIKSVLIKRLNQIENNISTSDMSLLHLVDTLLKVELQLAEKNYLKQIESLKQCFTQQKLMESVSNGCCMNHQDISNQIWRNSENERRIEVLTKDVEDLEHIIETKNLKLVQLSREKIQLEMELKVAHQKLHWLEKRDKSRK